MTVETRGRRIGRWLFALAFMAAGVIHLVAPQIYDPAMPPGLPQPRALILLSGLAEIAGGLGLLAPRPVVRRAAGWGLALLLGAVFPANVWMALAERGPAWALWARLPVQGALVAAVLIVSGAVRIRPEAG